MDVSTLVGSIVLIGRHGGSQIGISLISLQQGSFLSGLIGLGLCQVDVDTGDCTIIAGLLLLLCINILLIVFYCLVMILALQIRVGDQFQHIILGVVQIVRFLEVLDSLCISATTLQGMTEIEVVASHELCAVALVEQSVGKLERLVIVLQVGVVVERQTVQTSTAGELVCTILSSFQTLGRLAQEVSSKGILGELVVSQLGLVHLLVVLQSLGELVVCIVHVGDLCIYRVVGIDRFELAQHLLSTSSIHLLIYAGILDIALRVLRV